MRTLNLVRSVLPNTYATKARGIVLCAIAVGAAYVYYLAVDADDAIPPAAADFIPMPPVVRAASITSPVYIIPDTATQGMPGRAAPPRTQVTRDLQTALMKTHCYDGPVTGKWSAASQAAMGAFLTTVNAHLPVGNPDEALLALVSSNSAMTCPSKSTVVADALNTPTAATYEKQSQAKVAIATDIPASASMGAIPAPPIAERSMLDHPWAQPEMLVPSEKMTPPAAAPVSTSSVEPAERDTVHTAPIAAPVKSVEASRAPTMMQVSAAASGGSVLHFEGGSVVSDPKPEIAPSPVTATRAKVTQRKAKSAKRRASQSNDSSFGMSFDSIQRSLSSLFD
ncbi:hypothetical protein [Hyphomicrobium denitrificans]|uniref:hypothetical protein n=1 Tax=Hyphomicrobium denitrificans TaxID=53399 RepID=UPI001FCB61FF|nr:hypothetical protein [Hyphomicrobium denitrificans]